MFNRQKIVHEINVYHTARSNHGAVKHDTCQPASMHRSAVTHYAHISPHRMHFTYKLNKIDKSNHISSPLPGNADHPCGLKKHTTSTVAVV